MATEIKLPQWTMAITQGTLNKWLVDVGDKVEVGTDLCEIEASKVTNCVQSTVAGTVLKLCVEEGDDIPVLTTLCIIGDKNEQI